MISLIDSNTTALLSFALDVTSMRHQAIAHNIANANTPGYRPVGVRFEEYMTDARDALAQRKSVQHSVMTGYRPMSEMVVLEESGADTVSLDMEVAKLSENTLHHQALLKALSRHFSIIGIAVSEGKR